MTMYMLLLVIIFVTFAVVAWRDFRFALTLLFGLLPTYLLRFSIGPVPTTALEIFILTLVAIKLVRQPTIYPVSWRMLKPWRVPMLLMFAAACFSAAHAPDIFAALGILKAYYVEPLLVLLLCYGALTNDTKRQVQQNYIWPLATSGVLVAVLGILQYITKLGIPAPWDVEGRITSIFDFPNAVGLFLAPIVAMLVVFLWTKHNQKLSSFLFPLSSLTLMLTAIILSKTEAALVAIPAALLITLCISHTPRRTKILVILLAIVFSTAAFGLSSTVREKLLLADVSGHARIAIWHETATYLNDHWLLGAGLSGFPAAIAPYHDATYFEIFQYPHSVLLNIWVELGLLGVLATILLTMQVAKTVWRHREDSVVLAVCAAFLTMLIHGLVDVPFFKNDLAIFTAGLLALLIIRSRSDDAIALHE